MEFGRLFQWYQKEKTTTHVDDGGGVPEISSGSRVSLEGKLKEFLCFEGAVRGTEKNQVNVLALSKISRDGKLGQEAVGERGQGLCSGRVTSAMPVRRARAGPPGCRGVTTCSSERRSRLEMQIWKPRASSRSPGKDHSQRK